MQIVKQKAWIFDDINGLSIVKKLEYIGRLAYKSEIKITEDSYKPFLGQIIKRGHLSVIEHAAVTVQIVLNRAIANEVVRHRIASYTQESTRYVDYCKKGIQFIEYEGIEDILDLLQGIENYYLTSKAKPQTKRNALPLCLKTELFMTANLRSWRNVFELRTAKEAHPEMRELLIPLLHEFKERIPIIFDDIIPYGEEKIAI